MRNTLRKQPKRNSQDVAELRRDVLCGSVIPQKQNPLKEKEKKNWSRPALQFL